MYLIVIVIFRLWCRYLPILMLMRLKSKWNS
jgi:hypothetical protein